MEQKVLKMNSNLKNSLLSYLFFNKALIDLDGVVKKSPKSPR